MTRFDQEKALQAVAVLLEYERSRRMNYMRLLKLLYIADRESLGETGRTITGDQPFAMERGPVLSHVYDLILGRASQAGHWDLHVHKERYEVELRQEPGRGRLSRYEVNKLLEISERHRDLDEWAMSELTHGFEEWRDNFPGGKSAAPIPWQAILKAMGKSAFVPTVAREESTREVFDALFQE